jgi:hypothetical protein
MKTVNIENGMPSPQEAMTILNNCIYAERAAGTKLLKIIHGYGSTGKGGTIRKVCRQKLMEYRRRWIITGICCGEDLTPFSEEGRRFAEKCPEIRKDSDWGMGNPGVTIVMFK